LSADSFPFKLPKVAESGIEIEKDFPVNVFTENGTTPDTGTTPEMHGVASITRGQVEELWG
jgi:hypothetical protein